MGVGVVSGSWCGSDQTRVKCVAGVEAAFERRPGNCGCISRRCSARVLERLFAYEHARLQVGSVKRI